MTIHAAASRLGNLVNTATVESPTDPTPPSRPDTDTPAPLANLTIVKDDGSSTYTAGNDVIYTITVSNTGPSDAQAANVTELLPSATPLVSLLVPATWTRTDGVGFGGTGTVTASIA